MNPENVNPENVLDTDVLVSAHELQVGDQLCAMSCDDLTDTRFDRQSPSGRVMRWRGRTWLKQWTVTRIDNDIVWARFGDDNYHVMFLHLPANASRRFWIRGRAASKQDDKFPHDCPYCSRKCWHGFTVIEHEDGGPCGPRD